MFILQISIIKQDNPQIINEPAWDSQETKQNFMRACGDCHSNETKWPWYSNIPPFSFLIFYDVVKGRDEFNVSEYHHGDGKKSAHEFDEGKMPLWIYTIMHNEANINTEDREKFIYGLEQTFGKYNKIKPSKNEYNFEE